jgi:hypothetical protein
MQKMGNLKPGAEYVYEQQDGITYAREKNASINSRVEIGWEYDTRTSDGRPLHDHMMDDKLWGIFEDLQKQILLYIKPLVMLY